MGFEKYSQEIHDYYFVAMMEITTIIIIEVILFMGPSIKVSSGLKCSIGGLLQRKVFILQLLVYEHFEIPWLTVFTSVHPVVSSRFY